MASDRTGMGVLAKQSAAKRPITNELLAGQ